MGLNRKEFLRLFGATVGAALGGSVSSMSSADTSVLSGKRQPAMTLIENVDILTMDSVLGEVLQGHVLIEGSTIRQVGLGTIDVPGASKIDGTGKILMPGMVDAHRHMWQTLLAGAWVRTLSSRSNYMVEANLKMSVALQPEDAYLSSYLGGLSAIDAGITSVVDHCNLTYTPDISDQAARGLRDSGVGGFFCYQIGPDKLTYGPGDSIKLSLARQQVWGPMSDWHLQQAQKIRSRYFSSSQQPLQFGIAPTAPEFGQRSPDQVLEEVRKARTLEVKLMTQHLMGLPGSAYMGLSKSYRVLPALSKAGLLGPDLLISHGNGFTSEELLMVRDSGAKIVATPFAEFTYPFSSAHGRAQALGIPAGIGSDIVLALSNDFFEHLRFAYYSLYKDAELPDIARQISSEQMLQMVTLGGAAALGMASEVGSISVGKRADLVLLDTSRIGFPPDGSLADRVLHFASINDVDSVWVAGRRQKSAGQLLNNDWEQRRPEYLSARKRVLDRSEAITLIKD